MSLVRQARACPGRRGGLGTGARGLGDTVTLTPVDQLALQVNRFGLDAPPAYQFHTSEFATGNPLGMDLASTAMLIYQRRAIDSYSKFADAASAKLIANANAGMSNPVAWVTQNLLEVTSVVRAYGDSVGLPPAPGSSIIETITGGGPLGIPVYAWIAATAVAVYATATRKRRSR